MFTGLVREIGTIKGARPTAGVMRLDIEAPRTAADLALGDSVAINGICLTVTAVRGRVFTVEAVGETRRLTTLGQWRSGRKVHLEPALRVGDALDGHLMQGHVDGLGKVQKLKRTGGGLALTISAGPEQRRFLTPKGSVAVDGVSLTVDEGPFAAGFTVNLIPHTLQGTNFAGLRTGDQVNLEMDVLVKAARSGEFSGLPSLDTNSNSNSNHKSPARREWTMDQLLAKGFSRPRPRK
ncbi:MAG: riboflavin synthase [Candidatus Krumholzibacteria bacterium]|nr:riboflavin synthase [Candidatus Krumholzibacteria bacterium]